MRFYSNTFIYKWLLQGHYLGHNLGNNSMGKSLLTYWRRWGDYIFNYNSQLIEFVDDITRNIDADSLSESWKPLPDIRSGKQKNVPDRIKICRTEKYDKNSGQFSFCTMQHTCITSQYLHYFRIL